MIGFDMFSYMNKWKELPVTYFDRCKISILGDLNMQSVELWRLCFSLSIKYERAKYIHVSTRNYFWQLWYSSQKLSNNHHPIKIHEQHGDE